jgi:hypothetical protein
MNLQQVESVFSRMKNPLFAFTRGFHDPHSYRGFYSELSFENTDNITLEKIRRVIYLAFNDNFLGYKGGEFKYTGSTNCHLAYQGECDELDSLRLDSLIAVMVAEYNMNNPE